MTPFPFIFPDSANSTTFSISLRPLNGFVFTVMPCLSTTLSISLASSGEQRSDPRTRISLKMSSWNGIVTSLG